MEDIKTLLIPEDFDTYQKDCPIDFTVYIEAEKLYRSAENIFYRVFDYKGEEKNCYQEYV